MRKTTKKEFKKFRDAVEKFCHILSLTDWNVTCYKKKMNSRNVGQADWNIEERTAGIGITEEHDLEDRFNPERYAAHEVAHLFLSGLDYLGRSRYVSEKEIELEQERIAMVLENILIGILEDIK